MQWLVVAVAALVGVGAASGACRWWYGRQIGELRIRNDKLERARQVASQHFAQARNQIEQLQKDLVAAHKSRAEARADARAEAHARRKALSEALDAADAASGAADPMPTHGFADTQPAA